MRQMKNTGDDLPVLVKFIEEGSLWHDTIVLVCFKLPSSFIPSSTVKIWRSTGNTGLENTKAQQFELCFASVKIFACGRKGRVKGDRSGAKA